MPEVLPATAVAPGGIVLVGLATALLLAAPSPRGALGSLLSPGAADPAAPVVGVVSLLAWTLLAWLLVVAAVTLAARVPGLSGRLAAAVGRRIAPFAVRRLVATALGLTMGVGALAAAPALADVPLPPTPPTASLDWPLAGVGQPTPRIAASPAVVASTSHGADAPLVVRAGDCLWGIAAAHLPADATDAQIALAWPAWWAANREAIGADPDLIRPGLQLNPPIRPAIALPTPPEEPS